MQPMINGILEKGMLEGGILEGGILEGGILNGYPWLLVGILPGVLNSLIALGDLNAKCKALPFFKPLRVPGFWLWLVLQFCLPISVFWWLAALSSRPAINLELLLKAGAAGGSLALLNAEIKIGDRSYDIKSSLYDPFVRIAYGLIEQNQRGKAARFWNDVKAALEESPDSVAGLSYLEEYFALALTLDPEAKYQQRLETASTLTDPHERAKALTSLLKEVNRRDLMTVLQEFLGEDHPVLKQYFPQRAVKVLVGRRR